MKDNVKMWKRIVFAFNVQYNKKIINKVLLYNINMTTTQSNSEWDFTRPIVL